MLRSRNLLRSRTRNQITHVADIAQMVSVQHFSGWLWYPARNGTASRQTHTKRVMREMDDTKLLGHGVGGMSEHITSYWMQPFLKITGFLGKLHLIGGFSRDCDSKTQSLLMKKFFNKQMMWCNYFLWKKSIHLEKCWKEDPENHHLNVGNSWTSWWWNKADARDTSFTEVQWGQFWNPGIISV